MCERCVAENAGPERKESDRKLSRRLKEQPFLYACVASAGLLLIMNISRLY